MKLLQENPDHPAIGEHTRLACWFRRLAETGFGFWRSFGVERSGEVRDSRKLSESPVEARALPRIPQRPKRRKTVVLFGGL